MSDHLKRLVLSSEVQKCLSQNSPSKAKQLQCRTEGSDYRPIHMLEQGRFVGLQFRSHEWLDQRANISWVRLPNRKVSCHHKKTDITNKEWATRGIRC